MKDIISVNIATDLNHTFECDANILGREGEGDTTQLQLTIPTALSSYDVYLEFSKPNGEKIRTSRLELEDGVAVYNVPHYVLVNNGEIEVQAIFEKENGATWKSSIKKFFATKSINAVDDIPEKEDFITEAQKILDELSGEVAEIAELLSNDTEFVETIRNSIEEATSVKTITGSRLKFFVGTQADYEVLEDKDNLFAIITDDTTRETLLNDIATLKEDYKNLGDWLVYHENKLSEHEQKLAEHNYKYQLVSSTTVENGETSIDAELTEGAYLFVYNNGSYYSGVGYVMPSSFDNEVVKHYIAVGVFGLYLIGTVNEETEATTYEATLRYITYFPDRLGEAVSNYSGSGTLNIYKIGEFAEGA